MNEICRIRLRGNRSDSSPANGQTNSDESDISPAAVDAVFRSPPSDSVNFATSGYDICAAHPLNRLRRITITNGMVHKRS